MQAGDGQARGSRGVCGVGAAGPRALAHGDLSPGFCTKLARGSWCVTIINKAPVCTHPDFQNFTTRRDAEFRRML